MKTQLKSTQELNKSVVYNSELILEERISKFALDSSNIGVWDFDVINKKVNYSEEAKKILNLELEEDNIASYNWQEKIHPDDLDNVLKNLLSHINNEQPNYISEHRILMKDGTYKWIKDIGKIIERDKDGNYTRMLGTTTNIDKRKKQEAKLIENQNIIKEQNKQLKNFALIVSHNLKSHTANFESLLEFYDDTKDEKERNEIITHLKTVNSSLTKTISNLNKIVNTHNIDNLSTQTLNLREVIVSTIKLLEVKIKKTNTIVNINIDSTLKLEFNLVYFESIIQNLLSNAIKYRHPNRVPIINIDAKTTEKNITIIIKDNGLGLDLNKYGDAVFGLYRTFHNNKNSEGVGLYLIKNQIEALNGTIDIESTVNVGTSFTLTFSK
ncbi:PAS domain-containing protein [Lacinutrix sp. C3R15]|uniref:sensor histidine kinase n=1 Tax=Flavobacteriaceae TaxID=49546 RepID=UPI001C09F43C|nr:MULTISPECIES: PAS domain-containing protein [Flavobacteriaceae]MBU2940322.1 PAS domain-containing protein [Lacinutrix sp. C3R15]MDO6623642.1 PAS domain-containing protein [Oceanihabitans sp. 1_MG-2023]